MNRISYPHGCQFILNIHLSGTFNQRIVYATTSEIIALDVFNNLNPRTIEFQKCPWTVGVLIFVDCIVHSNNKVKRIHTEMSINVRE